MAPIRSLNRGEPWHGSCRWRARPAPHLLLQRYHYLGLVVGRRNIWWGRRCGGLLLARPCGPSMDQFIGWDAQRRRSSLSGQQLSDPAWSESWPGQPPLSQWPGGWSRLPPIRIRSICLRASEGDLAGLIGRHFCVGQTVGEARQGPTDQAHSLPKMLFTLTRHFAGIFEQHECGQNGLIELSARQPNRAVNTDGKLCNARHRRCAGIGLSVLRARDARFRNLPLITTLEP